MASGPGGACGTRLRLQLAAARRTTGDQTSRSIRPARCAGGGAVDSGHCPREPADLPKGGPRDRVCTASPFRTIGERPSWTFPCIRPRRASSFYLVDRASGRVLQTFSVAHGQGSEGSRQSYAEVFSNIPDTNASSLGLYRTAETYVSEAFAGPAMRMAGSRRRTRTPDRDSSSSTALGIWSRSRGKASGQGDQG